MNRRCTLGIVTMAALALMLPGSGQAQNAQQRPPAAEQKAPAAPPKPMKEAIVGTWSLLIDDAVKADGTHAPNFGPNPIGVAMFGADGHFSVTITRAGRPKFASNNRTTGTADENKAVVTGSNAFFGTYARQRGRQVAHASGRRQHLPEPGGYDTEAHHHLADRGR